MSISETPTQRQATGAVNGLRDNIAYRLTIAGLILYVGYKLISNDTDGLLFFIWIPFIALIFVRMFRISKRVKIRGTFSEKLGGIVDVVAIFLVPTVVMGFLLALVSFGIIMIQKNESSYASSPSSSTLSVAQIEIKKDRDRMAPTVCVEHFATQDDPKYSEVNKLSAWCEQYSQYDASGKAQAAKTDNAPVASTNAVPLAPLWK